MPRSVPVTLPPALERVRRNFERCIRIDTRTLAVFRVFVGLLIIADLFLRSRNFSFFYTDDGVVPRSLAMDMSYDSAFSFYHLTTDPTLIAALFVIQGLIAVQLIAGYKTRVATVLSFLFVVSLDHHNPLVLSNADTLFRLLLFWAIFLPLGERWSIDAVHRDARPRAHVANVATFLALLQIVYMYFLNGFHKSRSELWTGGDATPLIMGLDNTTFLLGDFMRNFPTLLKYGGLTWYYMLLFSWLLIFLVGRRRMLLVAMFMSVHASFAVTVRIGAFPYVSIAGLLLFVQAQFWDDGKALLEYLDVYDSRVEPFVTELDEFGTSVARMVPPLSVVPDDFDRAREIGYSVAVGVVVASVLLFAAITFLVSAGAVEGPVGPEEQIETVAVGLNINQPDWSIFAPNPRTTDQYYVFPAETADGEVVDAYNERELTYERAHDELQKQYGTYRERFYMNSVRRGGAANDVAPTLAEHICTTWEDEHGVELTHVNMYEIRETVTLDTIDSHEDRERSSYRIYQHGCGDNESKLIEPPEF